MPLQLPIDIQKPDLDIVNIRNENGKKVGTLQGIHGKLGLGLMRVQDVLKAEKLMLDLDDLTKNPVIVKIHVPTWWPKVAPKNPQNR